MAKLKKEKDPNKLGLGRLLAYKSSDVAAAAISFVALQYLTLYCTDTLGLNPAILGALLMAGKIIDGAVDIFYGWLVDNTNSKLGKGRPYELCIVGATLTTILLFSASPEWSMAAKYIWVFSMYTLVFSVFNSLRTAGNIPYTIRAFSNNNTLLTKVASYGGMVTMMGSIAVSTTFPMVMAKLATSSGGWTTTIAIYMVPLTLIGLLRFIFIKEDPSVDAGQQYQKVQLGEIFDMLKKNKYVWFYALASLCFNVSTSLGAASYYFKWIVGDESKAGLVSIMSFLLVPVMLIFPVIMKKLQYLGRMVSVFCVISTVGYVLVFFAGANMGLIIAGMILAGLVTLPMSYYSVLFISRCCTYNEMIGMQRMDGSSNILALFMANFGGALGSFISGILLSLGKYNYGEAVASQPDSALMMIRLLYTIVPALLVVGCGFCAWKFVALEKKIPEWEAEKEKENGSDM